MVGEWMSLLDALAADDLPGSPPRRARCGEVPVTAKNGRNPHQPLPRGHPVRERRGAMRTPHLGSVTATGYEVFSATR